MMVADPDLFLRAFIDAGSDSILVHWEGKPSAGHDG
jgi:pentose-5-phosphate-3-epimerase